MSEEESEAEKVQESDSTPKQAGPRKTRRPARKGSARRKKRPEVGQQDGAEQSSSESASAAGQNAGKDPVGVGTAGSPAQPPAEESSAGQQDGAEQSSSESASAAGQNAEKDHAGTGQRGRRRPRWPLFAALFVLLASASFAGIWFYGQNLGLRWPGSHLQEEVSRLARQLEDAGQQRAKMEKKFAGLEARQNQLEGKQDQVQKSYQSALDQMRADLETVKGAAGALARREIKQETDQLRREMESQRPNTNMAEAEYWLRTAIYLMTRLRDQKAALRALRQVDAVLRTSNRTDAPSLGQKLQDAIQKLADFDPGGEQQVQQLLADLRLAAQDLKPISQMVGVQAGQEAGSSWWRSLYQQYLSPQLRYQRTDEPPPILVGNEQLALARQRMELALARADYALLRLDPEQFRLELQNVEGLAERYFDIEDGPGKEFMANLQLAGAREIAPELPNLEPLMRALVRLRQAE